MGGCKCEGAKQAYQNATSLDLKSLIKPPQLIGNSGVTQYIHK